MYSKGGIYADLDHEALRPFDTLLDQHKSDDIILGHLEVDASSQWANHAIPNSLMISKPKCDFWLFVIDEMVRRAKGTPTGDHAILDAVEYKTGPVLLTECVRAYKGESKITILPTETFYPINWTRMEPMHQPLRQRIVSEGHHLSHEQAQAIFPHSLTVTYWTHTW